MNMDREAKEYYEVIIQAKDMGGQLGGLAGTTTVNVTLSDVNDNPPRFPQSEYLTSEGAGPRPDGGPCDRAGGERPELSSRPVIHSTISLLRAHSPQDSSKQCVSLSPTSPPTELSQTFFHCHVPPPFTKLNNTILLSNVEL